MIKDYENIFSKIAPPAPPDGLFASVISGINAQRRTGLRRRAWVYTLASALSFAAFFPIAALLRADLASSGLLQFISMTVSHPAISAGSWSDFAASLLESLPVLSITALLGASLAFLYASKFAVKNMSALKFNR